MYAQLIPKGLSGCGCGGSCGGCGAGAYVPTNWRRELAAYSLGGLRGLGDWTDPSTWGPMQWGTVAAVGALVFMGMKKVGRVRRSRRAYRRVMEH